MKIAYDDIRPGDRVTYSAYAGGGAAAAGVQTADRASSYEGPGRLGPESWRPARNPRSVRPGPFHQSNAESVTGFDNGGNVTHV